MNNIEFTFDNVLLKGKVLERNKFLELFRKTLRIFYK